MTLKARRPCAPCKIVASFSLETLEYRRLTAFGSFPAWLDEERLIFVHNDSLYLLDTATGDLRKLHSVAPDGLGTAAPAADGQYEVYTFFSALPDAFSHQRKPRVWLYATELDKVYIRFVQRCDDLVVELVRLPAVARSLENLSDDRIDALFQSENFLGDLRRLLGLGLRL